MRYAIWYHFYTSKNMKNTQEGMLFLIKLQALASKFTKSNTPLWVFFTFFKLYRWCKIAQIISYVLTFQYYRIKLAKLFVACMDNLFHDVFIWGMQQMYPYKNANVKPD